jgi:hypothetical protein
LSTRTTVLTHSSLQDFEQDGYHSSDTEGEIDRQSVPIEDIADEDLEGLHQLSLEDVEVPSLGYLDETLQYLAAERDRFDAARNAAAAAAAQQEGTKKKRRRKHKSSRATSTARSTATSAATTNTSALLSPGDDNQDADDSSSSYDPQYSTSNNNTSSSNNVFKSTPGTPRRRRGRLRHSRSTPQLRPVDGDEEPIRVIELRTLAKKLEKLCPDDKEYLQKISYSTEVSSPHRTSEDEGEDGVLDPLGGFVDTRGTPPSKREQRLIHVFVDQYVHCSRSFHSSC